MTEMVKQMPLFGGKPKVLIIISKWRSGSTFLAEMISSNLKNIRYMIYEPLMAKFRTDLDIDTQMALDTIKAVSKCHYDKIDDMRHFAMEAMHHRNPGLWQQMWIPKHTTKLKYLRNWTNSEVPTAMNPIDASIGKCLKKADFEN